MTSRKPSNYLALDPSLREYGWAIFQNNKIIDCGCIFTEPTKGAPQSVSDIEDFEIISDDILKVIKKYKPTRAYMEIPIGSRNKRVAQTLGMVQGITMALLKAKGIPFQTVMAKQVKVYLTGKDSASKTAVVRAVQKKVPSVKKFFTDFRKLSYSKNRIEAVADAAGVYLTLRKK